MSSHQDHRFRIGEVVSARVEQALPFGVFVRLGDGSQGYVRRRELTQSGTQDPRQVVSEGQEIQAAVIALPDPGRKLELSVRRAEPDPWDRFTQRFRIRDTVSGTVKWLSASCAWVEVVPGVDGLVSRAELAPWPVEQPGDLLWIGDRVQAMITHLDRERKRLRLSIRRQMLHLAQAQRIAGRLQADQVAPVEPEPEPDEPGNEEQELVHLGSLGRVLVIDDHPTVLEQLAVWLRRHGCEVDGASLPKDARERLAQAEYDLALVDLDLAGQDGLEFIRVLHDTHPETRVMVMSIPEWIAERSRDLEALGVVDVFAKPLDLDEVLDTLSRLARGEALEPFRITPPAQIEEAVNSFQQLAMTMRSGTPLEDRLQAGVAALVRSTGAELGVLFHSDPVSRQVNISILVGTLPVNYRAEYALSASPVNDVIQEGDQVFEARLSDQDRRRFQKLLDLVQFEACLGVPVAAAGQVEHALFLFHRQADAFARYRLRDAHAAAALLGVALESHALEARIQEIGPFLLSGHLAAGFGHDVFNKMSALELQVRNLRAAYRRPADQASVAQPTEPARFDQVAGDVELLLETTVDLTRTVKAFRELIRAEDQVEVDVNLVVQHAALLLASTARRQKVGLRVDLAEDLPPVMGSPVRLQQVVLNIMLNAVQHMAQKLKRWPGGRSELRVVTGLDAGAKPVLWVRFEDTGPGIHRQLWEDIFALGYSSRPQGTGLGLFIARSLVESMGGKIYVEDSTIPSSTTFQMDLPAVHRVA